MTGCPPCLLWLCRFAVVPLAARLPTDLGLFSVLTLQVSGQPRCVLAFGRGALTLSLLLREGVKFSIFLHADSAPSRSDERLYADKGESEVKEWQQTSQNPPQHQAFLCNY